jgi:AcrR family transcriptional regulator
MAGLRQKKKETQRQNILAAAAEVFQNQGYAQTTVADIALQANAGVGTCYNYFPSKAHLFCESMLFRHEDVLDRFDAVQTREQLDPSDIIMEMIHMVLEIIKPMDKRFLQEVLQSLTEMYIQQSNSPSLLIKRLVKQRYKVLEACKRQGLLPEELNIEDTLVCLFSILLVQIAAYVLDESMTMDNLYQSLDSKVRLFFQGKVGRGEVWLAQGEGNQ